MEGGGGREQNYWPGFVDVLSNVVLVLVFVLVVFVMALSLSANKVEQKMQEIVKQKNDAKKEGCGEQKSSNVEKNNSGEGKKNENETIAGNIEIKNTEDTQLSGIKLDGAPVDIKESSGKLILYYPLSGVELDKKAAAELEAVLEKNREKLKKYKIILNSYIGKEQYSVANRLAYYRILYVRKFLIDKGFSVNSSIRSKILQSEEQGIGHVEIVFQNN